MHFIESNKMNDQLLRLTQMTTTELINMTVEMGFPLRSRLSRVIVGSDLAFNLELPPSRVFTADKETVRFVAYNCGINYDSINANYSIVVNTLRENDFHTQYMEESATVSAFVTRIFENNLQVPQRLWFNNMLDICFMSLDNLTHEIGPNTSARGYLERGGSFEVDLRMPIGEKMLRWLLNFQTVETLILIDQEVDKLDSLRLPESLPSHRVLIYNIIRRYQIIKSKTSRTGFIIFNKAVEICKRVNSNTDRETLYQRWAKDLAQQREFSKIYYANRGDFTSTSRDYILAFPPMRYEAEMINNANNLRGVFEPLFVPNVQITIEDIFILATADPTKTLTKEDLVRIVTNELNEEYYTYTKRAIYNVCGLVFCSMSYLRKMSTQPCFNITFSPQFCDKTEDFYGDEFQRNAPTIIYGTFSAGDTLKCYSPQDLENAFIKENGLTIFRIPDKPSDSFEDNVLVDLAKLLNYLLPTIGDTFPEVQILTNKITDGLRNNKRVGEEVLTILDQETKNKLIQLFKHLFDAGMYQRTWKGPGHPYPVKSGQSRGTGNKVTDQCIIDEHMTRELGAFYKLLNEDLTPQIRSIVKNLNMYNYGERYIKSSELLGEYTSTVLHGQGVGACVALAQSKFISSANRYLNILGYQIPGFDITQFEASSFHRD